jgi:hypothetical protein
MIGNEMIYKLVENLLELRRGNGGGPVWTQKQLSAFA